jgi:putative cell wall-binding protein/flagellum-specific peptidoglycan hydrolase FlgJ
MFRKEKTNKLVLSTITALLLSTYILPSVAIAEEITEEDTSPSETTHEMSETDDGIDGDEEVDSPYEELMLETSSSINRQHNNGIYTVREGNTETFYSIAKSFGVSIRQLEIWNPSINPHNMPVGTRLAVTRQGVESRLSAEQKSRRPQSTYTPPYSSANINEFINHFAPLAVEIANQEGEEQLWPSLMIAQALHESGAARDSGMSQLSSPPYHNLFGIKADSGDRVLVWTWESVNDSHNETDKDTIAVDVLADFRRFPNYRSALQGYADLLRYRQFTWDSQEYYYSGAWASNTNSVWDVLKNKGLRGYATDPNYFAAIERYINDYDLTRFDPNVERVKGSTRFDTATQISANGWETANTVVLANAYDYADALSGVPLAYALDAPILLTAQDKLNSHTQSEINRLGASNVVILGGEHAVSNEIESTLSNQGLSVRRLAGENRYQTSGKIANEVMEHTGSTEAVLVSGEEFADAMSVAPFAAREGMPIFLTRRNTLSGQAQQATNINYWRIIGGPNAIERHVVNRLSNQADTYRIFGSDRYNTNQSVIRHFGTDSNKLYIATGENFVDALTGSVLAAKENTGVLLSIDQRHIVNRNITFSRNNNFYRFTLFGGENVLPSRLSNSIQRFTLKGY